MTDYNLRPPIRFWFEGDERAAKGYIPRARHLLSHMIRQMEMGDVEALDWHYREEGVYYELHKFGDQHVVLIRVDPESQQVEPRPEPEIKPEPEPVKYIRELVSRVMTGHVYLDANWSREEDAGDSPMPRVTVKLLDEDDSELDETETNEDGDFSFVMDSEGVEMAFPMSLRLEFVRNDELPESYQSLEGKDAMKFDLDPAIAREPYEIGEGQRVTWVAQDLGNFGFAPLTGYLWAGVKVTPIPYNAGDWGDEASPVGGVYTAMTTTSEQLTEYNGSSTNLQRVPNGYGSQIGVIQGAVNETFSVKNKYASGPSISLLLTEPATIRGIDKVTGASPLTATGTATGEDGVLVYDNNTLTWTAPGSVMGAPVTITESGRYDIEDGDGNVLVLQVDVEQLPDRLKRDESVSVEMGDGVGSGSGYTSSLLTSDADPFLDDNDVMFVLRQPGPILPSIAQKDYLFRNSKGIPGAIYWKEGEVVAYPAQPGPGPGQFRVAKGTGFEYWHPGPTPIACPSHACTPYPIVGIVIYEPATMTVTPGEPGASAQYFAYAAQVMLNTENVQPYSGGPFVFRKDKPPDCQAFVCVDPADPAKTAADFALPPPTITGVELFTGIVYNYTSAESSQGGIKQRAKEGDSYSSAYMTPSGDWYIYWQNRLILLDPTDNFALDGDDLQGFRGTDPNVNEYAFVKRVQTSEDGVLDPIRQGSVIRDRGHQHTGQLKPGLYRLDIAVYPPGGTKPE